MIYIPEMSFFRLCSDDLLCCSTIRFSTDQKVIEYTAISKREILIKEKENTIVFSF